jgi:cation transport protein ChaC
MARKVLAQAPDGDLWVFAYGSLIWKPEFTAIEEQKAIAYGWHREFCLRITRWRGTRETPALMMALDRGGSCTGIAYRLSREDPLEQIIALLRRETDGLPATNVPRWVTIRSGGRSMTALAFVAARNGIAYSGHHSHEEVAQNLARAAGHWGSAADYLQRTVSKLDEHGIRDRNLWAIQKLVADEILKLTAQRKAA